MGNRVSVVSPVLCGVVWSDCNQEAFPWISREPVYGDGEGECREEVAAHAGH